MIHMRAKMRVSGIARYPADAEVPTQETLKLHGVSKSAGYPADGSDEDNTFAKFSPMVDLTIAIANPALIGTFEVGDTFYVDFTKVN